MVDPAATSSTVSCGLCGPLTLTGSNPIFQIVPRWLSLVIPERPGLESSSVSRRAQSSAPSCTYFIQQTFLPYLLEHLATGHLYADDVQTFVHGPPAEQISLVGSIDSLSHDLHSWMSANRLSLNSSKTQLIWFGTKQQLLKLDLPLLTSMYPDFTYSSECP